MSAWFASNSNLINTIGLNAILALSVYVMLACGQLSLASPAYMAVGAYSAALLTIHQNLPFVAELAIGMLLSTVVAFLLGLPLLRLRGVYLAIATVGFVAVTEVFFTNWSPGGGGQGTPFIPAATTTWEIWLALGLLCYLFWRFEGSALGRNFAAIRQDEEVARSLGINTVSHKLAAFAFSGLIAGLAGVLYARLHFFVDPKTFDINVGLDALVYVVVGGSLIWIGSPLGAFLLTNLPEWLRPLGDWRGIGDGLILLAVILFLPGGLVELPRRALAIGRDVRRGYRFRPGTGESGRHEETRV
jgi:branched-chain amino acid transport system permease protein